MRLSLHPTARLQTWGIAILRVVVGSVFLVHGAQKLFMLGIPAVAAFMTHIGMPLPMASARLLTVVEFFCGLALVAGLLTRWAAVPLAVVMAVAMIRVHLSAGFFLPNGFEYALMLLGACVALTCLGPGALAIDNWLATDHDKPAARSASVARAA
jgi:putative oxidoreductase